MIVNYSSKIYVAGHKGLVGSAIVKRLKERGFKNIITIDKSKLDLTNQSKVLNFFKKKKPKFIFLAAAKVGGIYSNNNFKADFIYNNLSIQNNVASITSPKLWGGIFVAIPTAIPEAPLTSKFGNWAGNTVGSFVVSS